MTKGQFYLHTLADHWQESGFPYAADLLRHHANEGVPQIREIVNGGGPQFDERLPKNGGPIIFGGQNLQDQNSINIQLYHSEPKGRIMRLGVLPMKRWPGVNALAQLAKEGHRGVAGDEKRQNLGADPKSYQGIKAQLNTAKPEAPEQDYRPNEMLPEDFYGYSRKRKYAAEGLTKEQFYLHTLADHWQESGFPFAADLLRHHANEGVHGFRDVPTPSTMITKRMPKAGGLAIAGGVDLGHGDGTSKLTFYHVDPGGFGGGNFGRRLGSVSMPTRDAAAALHRLHAEGHPEAMADFQFLTRGQSQRFVDEAIANPPKLNTARPHAEEVESPPTPEDFLAYSRARLARAKARHDGRKAARKLAKRLGVDPAADADPYLFPEERDTVLGFKPDTRQQFGDMVRRGAADRPGVLPGVGELKSLAQVGDPVRGSYEDAFTTVLHLLKNPRDAHRWVAANAILSAQTAWEKHTAGATKALAAWHAANRPTDKAGLDRVFSPTGRNDRNASILTGDGMLHKNNVSQYTGAKADALKRLFAQGDDFDRAEWGHISEGSYKTPNFGLAFIDPRGGPIDTHMLKLTVPGDEPVINPKKPPLNPEWTRRAVHLFAEKKQLPPGTETPLLDAQKKLADRPAAVIAYKVLTVQAARELGWEVRQVQEAVWTAVLAVSVAKHLGARDADEALKKLTRSAVQAGWSLNTVLRHPEVVRDLAQLGVPTRKIAAAIKASERRLPPGPGPVRTGDLAAVDSAARRLPAGIPTGAQPIYDRLTLGRRRMAREKPLTVPIHAILPDKENLEVAADSLHRGHRSEDTRPLEVYRVGKRFVLADGHHRLLQAILAGDTTATVSPRETDRPPGTKYTVPLDPDADLYGLPDRLPRNGWLLKRLKLGRRRKYSHRAFGEQMRAEPGNGTHPLVWADYLQEQGHDEAADVVRRHVAIAGRLNGPYRAMAHTRAMAMGLNRPWEPFADARQSGYTLPSGEPAWGVYVGQAFPDGTHPHVSTHHAFILTSPAEAAQLLAGMARSGLHGAEESLGRVRSLQPDGPQRMGRPYRAPAGGTVVRGVFYEGGSMIPDLAGPFATGQTPSRPAPPPKSRKINWAAALRRWTGRQRNR